jgi:uncharacterized membrane protein YdbT with pleckstrin-like domain
MLADSDEQVRLDARRHGVVLARPLAKASLLTLLAGVAIPLGFPFAVVAAVLTAAAAAVMGRAVWQWERTRILLTATRLTVMEGTLRRRTATVPLGDGGAVEIEQSLLGRLLGYGTLIVGELEVPFVPAPRRPYELVERLAP